MKIAKKNELYEISSKDNKKNILKFYSLGYSLYSKPLKMPSLTKFNKEMTRQDHSYKKTTRFTTVYSKS